MYSRRDQNVDEIRFIDPLEKPEQSVICPIKLILIHALRHGYVHGTTIQQVLDHAAARSDRIIQWTKPDNPVLCQMVRTGAFLNLEQPANIKLINVSVKIMGLLAGVIGRITARSIRNGAARDNAHLKKIPGTDHRAAALLMGHKEKSVVSGTTAKMPMLDNVLCVR